MFGLAARCKNTSHTMYRDPAGELVEYVKRHINPGNASDPWITVEYLDGHRSDYLARQLEEVHH